MLLAAHAALPSPLPHGAAGGEPPTPPGRGDTAWAAKPKGDEGRGCGSNGTEVGTSPPDGISPPNLSVPPAQGAAGAPEGGEDLAQPQAQPAPPSPEAR